MTNGFQNCDCVLRGQWQGGQTSRQEPAQLVVAGDQVSVVIAGEPTFSYPITEVSITPRVGSTPRYIRFGNHRGRLEVEDSPEANWLDARVGSAAQRLLHRLESHTLLVVAAGAVVLMLGVAYFVWGIPAVAHLAARQMPTDLLDRVSAETLETLQSRHLQASALDDNKINATRDLLRTHAPDYAPDKLRFAGGGELGANAFALPDGTIVVTDELVALADNDTELLAVLAHELGHIERRHALRQLLQGAAIGVTIALISGDVSAVGDVALTLPVVFTQLHYSREFELEADRHALDFLERNHLDTAAFAAMLRKLHEAAECGDDTDSCRDRERVDYLSTHPHIDRRLEAIIGPRSPSD